MTLGERVERERSQYLRDSQRSEDRSSGFDVNASSNGVYTRLGGTVDLRTLVARPAMAVTSSNGLGASTMTGVNGVAKGTSREGESMCGGGTLDDGADPRQNITQQNGQHSLRVQLP